MGFFLTILIVNIIFAFIGSSMAKKRKRDAAAWALICALTGLLGVIALAISGDADASLPHSKHLLPDSVDTNLVARSSDSVADTKQKNYDEKKWHALLDVDDELKNAASLVQPFGQTYVDELAEKYLILNERAYLANLVEKITARAELERQQENLTRLNFNAKRQEELDEVYNKYVARVAENDGRDPDYGLIVNSVERYTGTSRAFYGGVKVKFEDGTFALRAGFLIRKFATEDDLNAW